MPTTGSDFSATSDETALGFALAEFQLFQPVTEGPSPCSGELSRGNM